MYTVDQVEQLIQASTEQRDVVFLLITKVRAEPFWQADVFLNEESRQFRDGMEASFANVRNASEVMEAGSARFRQQAGMMRFSEDTEETQDILEDLVRAHLDMAAGRAAMTMALFTILNGLLEQRGQPPFEFVSPNAN